MSSNTDTASRAVCFLDTLRANVNNEKLSDADFRRFVENSLKALNESALKEYRCVFGRNSNVPNSFYDMEKAIRFHKDTRKSY